MEFMRSATRGYASSRSSNLSTKKFLKMTNYIVVFLVFSGRTSRLESSSFVHFVRFASSSLSQSRSLLSPCSLRKSKKGYLINSKFLIDRYCVSQYPRSKRRWSLVFSPIRQMHTPHRDTINDSNDPQYSRWYSRSRRARQLCLEALRNLAYNPTIWQIFHF